jgi:hypothetical protein
MRDYHLRLRIPRLFLQVLGELSGGDGAFADRGGDAFDRAVADVAGGEDAGHAGLQGYGGAGFNNLQFVSSKVAWVVWEPVTLGSADQGKVYVTRDGGQHWSLATI